MSAATGSDGSVVSGSQEDWSIVSTAPADSAASGGAAGFGGGAAAGERQPDLHIFAAIVENKFGVLARIAGLFSRRGFNIFSLAVAPTDDPAFSRVTIVVDVGNTDVNQVAKQLDKLVNVVHISEMHPSDSVERELMLARVRAGDLAAVRAVIGEYGGEVLDHDQREAIVSVSAHPDRLDRCERQLRPFGMHVLQRTGRIALRKLGEQAPAVALPQQAHTRLQP